LNKKYITINDWQIEPQNGLANHPVRGSFQLKNKSMQVLMLLAQANGEIVLKSDILKTVWPDTIVTENSLSQAISELRKMFGDSRSAPKYIQTFPNQGYSLLVMECSKAKKIQRWLITVKLRYFLLAASLLLGSLSYWMFANQPNKVLIKSPNGQYWASIAGENSNYSLGIYAIDNSEVQDVFFRILRILSPQSFAWSTDSKYFIAAIANTEDSYHFIISPVAGIDKFSIDLPKQLNTHEATIKLRSNTGTALPFAISKHVVISKMLHVWQLSNGQSIQIHFDQVGPSKISWH